MLYDAAKRYFDRMDMAKILARIQSRIAELGTTEAAVSMKAKGSTDTIRNWRRRVDKGEKPGASLVTLQPIADTLGVPLDWLLGNGSDSIEEYLGGDENAGRDELIRIYGRLSPKDRARALKIVSALDQIEDEEQS